MIVESRDPFRQAAAPLTQARTRTLTLTLTLILTLTLTLILTLALAGAALAGAGRSGRGHALVAQLTGSDAEPEAACVRSAGALTTVK